ncbi:MAG: serine hydroxymethyltransferase [bacterium]|nr:serine hydroxymethyltransferase [bacterium]
MKDKIIKKLIKAERQRQKETINLIASENFVSKDILEALGSELTNKYSEGYPGKRYYPGNKYYDEIEEIAKKRALKAFGLNQDEWSVNVQSYSGSPANFEIYSALLKPGEKLMGMALTSGGHLTHGHKASLTGKFWKSVQYTTGNDGLLNYDEIESLAKKEKPKVIVSGFSAYPRKVDFERFGEIANSVGAYHHADISHIAGLIVAGLHPSPFLFADTVMTTTHKTLRGPRGAVIFSRRKKELRIMNHESSLTIAEAIDKAIFPGLQGGPHNNVISAIAVTFFEALRPSFKKYQKQIIKNAVVLSNELKKLGFNLVTGGTDTHLVLINLSKSDFDNINGLEAEKKLEAVGIIANRNTVPGDESPFNPSGLRLGTPAITTRGMKEKDMKKIAELIYKVLRSPKSDVPNIVSLALEVRLPNIGLTSKATSVIKKEVLALARRNRR